MDPGVDPGVDPDATSCYGTLMDLVFWWKPVVIQVGFLRQILLDPCGGSWRGSCGGSRWWILLKDPSGSWSWNLVNLCITQVNMVNPTLVVDPVDQEIGSL